MVEDKRRGEIVGKMTENSLRGQKEDHFLEW
jgi:hypothetical protein